MASSNYDSEELSLKSSSLDRTTLDMFGIKKLYPSIPDTREFYAPTINPGPVHAVQRIEGTEMVVHGTGSVNPNLDGIYVMNGRFPRLYVYTAVAGVPELTWDQYYWHNVEMTCYYKRASRDSSPIGIKLGAIGYHHFGGSNAKVYYLMHNFESGTFKLQKENHHTSSGEGYIDFEPSGQPNTPVVSNRWYGLKFVVRSDAKVTVEERPGPPGEGPIEVVITRPFTVLEGYTDNTDGENGGDWKKVIELIDKGNWGWGPPYVYGPSCFVRSDQVNDFMIKRFSIRVVGTRPSWIDD